MRLLSKAVQLGLVLTFQDAELKTLGKKSMYKAELYWCHQLLYPEWKADMPHSGDFLYFTEKDLLVT